MKKLKENNYCTFFTTNQILQEHLWLYPILYIIIIVFFLIGAHGTWPNLGDNVLFIALWLSRCHRTVWYINNATEYQCQIGLVGGIRHCKEMWTRYNLSQVLKITHLLMNREHNSIPALIFSSQAGWNLSGYSNRFPLWSVVAWLIVCNDWDKDN